MFPFPRSELSMGIAAHLLLYRKPRWELGYGVFVLYLATPRSHSPTARTLTIINEGSKDQGEATTRTGAIRSIYMRLESEQRICCFRGEEVTFLHVYPSCIRTKPWTEKRQRQQRKGHIGYTTLPSTTGILVSSWMPTKHTTIRAWHMGKVELR